MTIYAYSSRWLVPFWSHLDAMTDTVRRACLCKDLAGLLASLLMGPLCFAPTPAATLRGCVSGNAALCVFAIYR